MVDPVRGEKGENEEMLQKWNGQVLSSRETGRGRVGDVSGALNFSDGNGDGVLNRS